ncbi:hypothetical protein N7499_000190 [Penicillium canescens]|nr:hypothetical protein N7499_000190 [Penicillium canescens]
MYQIRKIKKIENKKEIEGDPSRSDNLVNWSHTRCQLRHTPNWLKFEGNPSRSDNLVNWSHTRCQLRHTPELVKVLSTIWYHKPKSI